MRTFFSLAITLVGFSAVCAFWHYLSSGRWFDFSLSAYHCSIGIGLGQTFVSPLGVLSHPWMILVGGLALAVMIFVPIVVAVLYRLMIVTVFLAAVAVLAHAPVGAGVLALSCLIAGRTHLRSDMPFLACLLGLVPVGISFYLFGFVGPDATLGQPVERAVLYAPFMVAVLAGGSAMAVVLVLTRVTGYRPGVVWPVLVLLAGCPVWLFYAKIGTYELDYAALTEGLAGGDAIISPIALDAWPGDGTEGLSREFLKNRLMEDLHRRREELVKRCQKYLSRYGHTNRAPAVMWLLGQLASLDIDMQTLEIGLVKYTSAWPDQRSCGVWEELLGRYPNSPQAALARWRLAELVLRDAQVQAGLQHLQAAHSRLKTIVSQSASSCASETVFRPAASIPSRRYYDSALFAVERLIWQIKRNDLVSDEPAGRALGAYLRLNPYDIDYLQRIGNLARDNEHTLFGDNLKLAVALAIPDLYERADMLISLADSGQIDVSVEANYELGRLALRTRQAPALPLVEKLASPQKYFELVVAAPPNPWAPLAEKNLAVLSAGCSPSGEPAR